MLIVLRHNNIVQKIRILIHADLAQEILIVEIVPVLIQINAMFLLQFKRVGDHQILAILHVVLVLLTVIVVMELQFAQKQETLNVIKATVQELQAKMDANHVILMTIVVVEHVRLH